MTRAAARRAAARAALATQIAAAARVAKTDAQNGCRILVESIDAFATDPADVCYAFDLATPLGFRCEFWPDGYRVYHPGPAKAPSEPAKAPSEPAKAAKHVFTRTTDGTSGYDVKAAGRQWIVFYDRHCRYWTAFEVDPATGFVSPAQAGNGPDRETALADAIAIADSYGPWIREAS